jgi:hypothetical protein
MNNINLRDTKAVSYVAAIEGINMPFVGLQFHPEYINNEDFNVNNSAESIEIS